MIILAVVVGLGNLGKTVVWAFIVNKFAHLGVAHPEHKAYFMQLARSDKLQLPEAVTDKLAKRIKE